MELPYRLPTIKSLFIHRANEPCVSAQSWHHIARHHPLLHQHVPRPQTYTVDYEEQAADVIASNLPWDETQAALCTLNAQRRAEELEYSIAGRIGKKINQVMQHAGFDWKASSALVGAFAAKELFVSQLAILNAVSDSDCDDANEMLRDRLRESYTPLQAFSIILFCLISMPCIATVAVVRRETNSWPLAIAQLATLTALAFVVSLLVYQGGLLLGFSRRRLSNTLASGHALRAQRCQPATIHPPHQPQLMSAWQPHLPYNALLCRYNEIATKGRNRRLFEEHLAEGLQRILGGLGQLDFRFPHGRIFALPRRQVCLYAG